MTDSDRARLDRIEAMLAEVLAMLDARPRPRKARQGPRRATGPIDPAVRAEARRRLLRAGIVVRDD